MFKLFLSFNKSFTNQNVNVLATVNLKSMFKTKFTSSSSLNSYAPKFFSTETKNPAPTLTNNNSNTTKKLPRAKSTLNASLVNLGNLKDNEGARRVVRAIENILIGF